MTHFPAASSHSKPSLDEFPRPTRKAVTAQPRDHLIPTNIHRNTHNTAGRTKFKNKPRASRASRAQQNATLSLVNPARLLARGGTPRMSRIRVLDSAACITTPARRYLRHLDALQRTMPTTVDAGEYIGGKETLLRGVFIPKRGELLAHSGPANGEPHSIDFASFRAWPVAIRRRFGCQVARAPGKRAPCCDVIRERSGRQ